MRWSVVTLLGICAALWVDALAGDRLVSGTAALVIVAVASLAAGLRAALLPLAVAGLASAALLSVADQVADPGKFGLASDGVFYCVVVLAPSSIGWLIGSRNRQVARLHARRRVLEDQRVVALRVARAEERERIVHRIDLGLAERLMQVVGGVRRARTLAGTEPHRVPGLLEQVEDSARFALDGLRDVLGTLRAAHSIDGPAATNVATDVGSAVGSVPDHVSRRVDLVDAALIAGSVPLAIETALPGQHGPIVLNVLAALTQGLALTLLRRRPLSGLAGLLAVAATQTAFLSPLPPTVSWLLPGLSAALLIGLTSARSTAFLGLAGLIAGVLGISLVTPAGHRATAGLVPGLVMGLLVWLGGRLAAAAQTRGREIRAITEELDQRQEDALQLAVLDQRAEIARDLHDTGAHALTVVCLQAAAARAWWGRDPDQARLAFESLATVADSTVSHVGRSLGGYARGRGPDILDLRSLQSLVAMGRTLGLTVDLGITGCRRPVPEDVVHVAYRVVQEGLTNAARHAAGSTVRIALSYRQDDVEVRVLDTGASAAAVTLTGAGAGLAGMRERVEAIRGELRAGPRGSGFEISARLPT